jgi:hypothetical protein
MPRADGGNLRGDDMLSVPKCQGIRSELLNDPAASVHNNQLLAIYDEQSRVGGIYSYETGNWSAWQPITEDKFEVVVLRAMAELERTVDETAVH